MKVNPEAVGGCKSPCWKLSLCPCRSGKMRTLSLETQSLLWRARGAGGRATEYWKCPEVRQRGEGTWPLGAESSVFPREGGPLLGRRWWRIRVSSAGVFSIAPSFFSVISDAFCEALCVENPLYEGFSLLYHSLYYSWLLHPLWN